MNKTHEHASSDHATRVRQYFDRIASECQDYSFVQQEVAKRLFERLEMMNTDPKRIIEVGCADGALTELVAKKYPKAKIIALDSSKKRLKKIKQRQGFFSSISLKQGDFEQLPCNNNSMDLVLSNLAYDYCFDQKRLLLEFNRVLKPGGLLIFSAFGPDSFMELRQAWLKIEPKAKFQSFYDMHIIGDQVQAAQFNNTLMDRDILELNYQSLRGLLRELKRAGGQNLHPLRSKGLWGKEKFAQYTQAFESYRTEKGHLPVTCELVFGHGWKKQDATTADYHTYQVKLKP